MSFETVRQNITARLNTNYVGSYPIEWPNTEIVKPKNDLWFRFGIAGPDEDRNEIGRAAYTAIGLIQFQVFAPKNTGVKKSMELMDTLTGIFRNTTFNSITCDGASITVVGLDEAWHQTNAIIPFEVDLVY